MTKFKSVDLTKPVQTRDGRKARVLCTDRKHITTYGDWCVIALITDKDGYESPSYHTKDGKHHHTPSSDLVNVPEVRFFNLGKKSYGYKYTFELTTTP